MHWPNKLLFGNVSGAELSMVRGAEFSEGPASLWSRVLAWVEFSAGPSSLVFF